MKWIFPRPIYDIIFVLFPGIIYLAYVLLFPNIEFDFLHIFLFINIAQSGHIFATLPRTYLRPLEFKRNSIYWWAPLGFSVFLLICSFFKFFLFALLIFQIAQQVHILRQYFGFGKIYQRKKFESLEEEVNSFAKKEIATNPGTEFFYGDMGLNIAGRVLEIITKKKFEVLMKQRIFVPLNMRSSTFIGEEDAINPSGGAISTAADYMNFLNMIFFVLSLFLPRYVP